MKKKFFSTIAFRTEKNKEPRDVSINRFLMIDDILVFSSK